MRFRAYLIIYVLIFAMNLLSTGAMSKTLDFSILHTNDLHSAVTGTGPDAYFTSVAGDGDPVSGHFARLAHEIKSQRAALETQGKQVLLLDGGDFFAGSLFHVLTPRSDTPFSPELEFLKMLNYDAVTIGNHEFDGGREGFLTMLTKNNQYFQVPLVSTNMHWDLLPAADRQLTQSQVKRWIVKEYLGTEGKPIRIGILGALGVNAILVSAGNREGFQFDGFRDSDSREQANELHQAIQQGVDHLKQQEGVDIVILVTHAGHPEDEAMATEIDGLDIIIAGHTHQAYRKLRRKNNVYIAQAGSNGGFLGKLSFQWTEGELKFTGDENNIIIDINDKVPADTEMLKVIERWEKEVNNYQNGFGYASDTPIFYSKNTRKKSRAYGTRICSLLLSAMNKVALENKIGSIDVYLSTLSLMRLGIVGNETQPIEYRFADVFRILPLGFDQRMNPGSPVVHFHLNKSDLRILIRFLELYHLIQNKFIPSFSDSISYEIRSWGIPFLNRLKDLALNNKPYEEWPDLVHIATSQYFAKFIPKINGISRGLINITPRDASGQEIKEPKIFLNQKEYQLLSKALSEKKIF